MKKFLFSIIASLLFMSSIYGQWQKVDSITIGAIQCVHFVNSDTGFVYNEWATMRKTVDGGQSWDTCEVAFDSYVFDIDFADANVGYAVGGAWFPFAKYYANSIMKTVDGGATWDSVYGNYNYGVFTDVEAISANEFFAVGEGWACHSSDGGTTVDTLVVSQSANERFLKISFLSQQHGYLLSQIFLPGQLSSYQVYETTNGGSSWQMTYSDTMFFAGFNDFQFSNSGDGLIIGEQGQVRINKGSNSWTVVALPDPNLWLHKVEMADGRLYAIGSQGTPSGINVLYSSVDFGVNWQKEQVKLDSMDYFTDLSFPEGGVGYLTSYSRLYKNSGLISIEEQHGPLNLSVYPNPTASIVKVTFPSNMKVSAQLLSISGALIREYSFEDAKQLEFNLNAEASGIYILNIVANGDAEQIKLVKK